MSDFVIEAKEVTKSLGRGAREVQALRGIDLSLRRGELTLLMGPSGSGKTTLLLILGCMLTPTSGTVTVCGAPTSDGDKEALAKIRRDHIGFVFQSYHLFPTLTAAQNVQLALDIRRERGRRAATKAREALDMVALQKKANTRPGELSGGEQQRVAIARALVANPSAPCWPMNRHPRSMATMAAPSCVSWRAQPMNADRRCWSSPTIPASCPSPTASSISRTASWSIGPRARPKACACRRWPRSGP